MKFEEVAKKVAQTVKDSYYVHHTDRDDYAEVDLEELTFLIAEVLGEYLDPTWSDEGGGEYEMSYR